MNILFFQELCERIRVVVRARPLNERYVSYSYQNQIMKANIILISIPEKSMHGLNRDGIF